MDCVKDHFEIPFFLNRLTDKEAHYQGDWTQCATCADLVWASMHALCLDIPKPDRVNKIHSESKDLRKRARKLPEMFLPAGHDRFEQTKPYPVGFEYPTLTALAERQLSTLFCPAPLK